MLCKLFISILVKSNTQNVQNYNYLKFLYVINLDLNVYTNLKYYKIILLLL